MTNVVDLQVPKVDVQNVRTAIEWNDRFLTEADPNDHDEQR